MRAADASCLNAPAATLHQLTDELHDCNKRLKRNNFPGTDGVLSEMIKDGNDVLCNCLLVIFNLMLVNHFPSNCLLACNWSLLSTHQATKVT